MATVLNICLKHMVISRHQKLNSFDVKDIWCHVYTVQYWSPMEIISYHVLFFMIFLCKKSRESIQYYWFLGSFYSALQPEIDILERINLYIQLDFFIMESNSWPIIHLLAQSQL